MGTGGVCFLRHLREEEVFGRWCEGWVNNFLFRCFSFGGGCVSTGPCTGETVFAFLSGCLLYAPGWSPVWSNAGSVIWSVPSGQVRGSVWSIRRWGNHSCCHRTRAQGRFQVFARGEDLFCLFFWVRFLGRLPGFSSASSVPFRAFHRGGGLVWNGSAI